MEALKNLFGGSLRQFGMLFVLVALAIFFHLNDRWPCDHADQPE